MAAPGQRSHLLDLLDSSSFGAGPSSSYEQTEIHDSPTAGSPDQTRDLVQRERARQRAGIRNAPASQDVLMSQAYQYVNRTPPSQSASRYPRVHLDDDDEENEHANSSSPTRAFGSTSRSARPMAGRFELNYDNQTPIQAIDIGGADQELRMEEFVSRGLDNVNNAQSVQEATEQLGLESIKHLLPGMEVRLLPHQLIGVNWMVHQEKHTQYKGGILADDMGLGKTVQMIACMAANLPQANEGYKTTLVVVPSALLLQWKEEIETKTNGLFSVHIYHGKDKLKSVSRVESFDVIITSYQTLCSDYYVPGRVEQGQESEWLAEHGGVLARSRYYRIVADEAQFIRNRSTRASIAMARVRSKYRWMLTGTPVTNSLADIFGLMRFGRFRPWNDWNDFNEHICRCQREDAMLAGRRAQAILQPVILRRTKDATIEGHPIIQLPPKEIEFVTIDFSADERDIYDSIEKKTQLKINKFINQRTLMKNHTEVLVLILRLRQLCNHPYLVLARTEGHDPTLIVASDREKELARATRIMGASWVAQVKRRFLARKKTEMFEAEGDEFEGSATCPVCKDLYALDSGRVLQCGHEICFECLMDLSENPIEHDGEFGQGTEEQNLREEKEYEEAQKKGLRPCPTCKKMMSLKKDDVFRSVGFEPSEEEFRAEKKKKRRRASAFSDEDEEENIKKPKLKKEDIKPDVKNVKLSRKFEEVKMDDSDDELPEVSEMFGKSFGKESKVKGEAIKDDDLLDFSMNDITGNPAFSGKPLKQPNTSSGKSHSGKNNDDPSQEIFDIWGRGDDSVVPSAKMSAMLNMLDGWRSTGDKTIVYSQWTSSLDLIQQLFLRHGIRYLRYDGTMNRTQREETLASFKRPTGPKVILISTKCGGVGLNLVSANRIINMDLLWNYASESQAYDRVYRLGQEKNVYIKRLVVRDTLEERMLKLQEVKSDLANVALGEGAGNKLHRLSVRDIKNLFGLNKPPAQRNHHDAYTGPNDQPPPAS